MSRAVLVSCSVDGPEFYASVPLPKSTRAWVAGHLDPPQRRLAVCGGTLRASRRGQSPSHEVPLVHAQLREGARKRREAEHGTTPATFPPTGRVNTTSELVMALCTVRVERDVGNTLAPTPPPPGTRIQVHSTCERSPRNPRTDATPTPPPARQHPTTRTAQSVAASVHALAACMHVDVHDTPAHAPATRGRLAAAAEEADTHHASPRGDASLHTCGRAREAPTHIRTPATSPAGMTSHAERHLDHDDCQRNPRASRLLNTGAPDCEHRKPDKARAGLECNARAANVAVRRAPVQCKGSVARAKSV